MISVIVAGFTGAMGQKTLALVDRETDLHLVGVYNPSVTDLQPASYQLPADVRVFNQLDQIDITADVWVDFSTPSGAFANTQFAITHNIRPVIGTSGLSEEQIAQLQRLAAQRRVGGLIAANFGVSAVLMMKFAQLAATYFDHAEIVEYHHDDKRDAPSGTALNTAKLIYEAQGHDEALNPQEQDPLGARGGDYHGIKIHAIRLPGFVADESVIFGGAGETLTLKQSTTDRESFMQGVRLALTAVMDRHELLVGLENLI